MSWVLILAASWLLIAVLAALLIGKGIRSADESEVVDDRVFDVPNFVVDLPAAEKRPDAPRAANDPPTIPGIPSARPTVGKPPAPPSDGSTARRQRPA